METDYSKIPLLIAGTGAEAQIALDIANALDVVVYGFITRATEETNLEINDLLILGELGSKDVEVLLQDENTRLVIAARESAERIEWVEALSSKNAEMITLIHPSAVVSPFARLGQGCLIGPLSSIMSAASIGSYSLILNGVGIAPEVEIGEHVTIEQGAQLGKGVVVGDECFIGAGAIIQPGVEIGREAMVGAGAVVMKNVPEGATVFGNPARVVD